MLILNQTCKRPKNSLILVINFCSASHTHLIYMYVHTKSEHPSINVLLALYMTQYAISSLRYAHITMIVCHLLASSCLVVSTTFSRPLLFILFHCSHSPREGFTVLYFNTRQPVEVYLHIHNCCDQHDQDNYGYNIGVFIPVSALLMHSRQPYLLILPVFISHIVK